MAVKSTLRILLVAVCCSLMAACTPLMRGFNNHELVSTGFPPITISSPLPPLTEGQGTAFIEGSSLLISADYWLSVYNAGDFASPMAIAVYTTAPGGFEWASSSASFIDYPVIGTADFGGQSFNVSVRFARAKNDPFAPLVIPAEKLKESGDQMHWLACRFVDMSANFWKTKIILEYREPIPANMNPAMDIKIYMGTQEMHDFMARAAKAFEVAFVCPDISIPRAPYVGKNINQRYLGKFIGTLQYIEPLDMVPDPD